MHSTEQKTERSLAGDVRPGDTIVYRDHMPPREVHVTNIAKWTVAAKEYVRIFAVDPCRAENPPEASSYAASDGLYHDGHITARVQTSDVVARAMVMEDDLPLDGHGVLRG